MKCDAMKFFYKKLHAKKQSKQRRKAIYLAPLLTLLLWVNKFTMRIITKPVWILSFVSMFADIASEMLYPIVPVYLKNVGFSILLIGVLEGVAELIVGLSKGYFGKHSDTTGRRIPYIRWGYLLSAVSKPMMAIFIYPFWILFARCTDRLGKGIRTAARDALLSQEATPATKARVFGFHRALDTTGAIIGPVIALVFLHIYPGAYRAIFFYAFIPGIIAVFLISLLREKAIIPVANKKGNFFSFFNYWKEAPADYRKLVAGLVIFAIANSSDVFLLLKVKEITGSDTTTILVYILYNIVFALAAYPIGILADKIGMKKVFITGLLLFVMVYGGFGIFTSPLAAYILFILYGIYAAATEGIAKAWISNLAEKPRLATAIGLYTSLQSLATLAASIIAGAVWTYAGSRFVFFFAAVVTGCVMLFLSTARLYKKA